MHLRRCALAPLSEPELRCDCAESRGRAVLAGALPAHLPVRVLLLQYRPLQVRNLFANAVDATKVFSAQAHGLLLNSLCCLRPQAVASLRVCCRACDLRAMPMRGPRLFEGRGVYLSTGPE